MRTAALVAALAFGTVGMIAFLGSWAYAVRRSATHARRSETERDRRRRGWLYALVALAAAGGIAVSAVTADDPVAAVVGTVVFTALAFLVLGGALAIAHRLFERR